MFITLDGIDGVGKSTQIARLMDHLADQGQETLLVRDPGTTKIGVKLREILLESELETTSPNRSDALHGQSLRDGRNGPQARPASRQDPSSQIAFCWRTSFIKVWGATYQRNCSGKWDVWPTAD